MTNNFRKWLVLFGGLIFFISDRFLKYLFILGKFDTDSSFFHYFANSNLAFSLPLPAGVRNFFYLFVIFVIVIIIKLFLIAWQHAFLLPLAAYWLVILGAASNLIDRFRYGAVIDFIDLKFWPVFNLADVMIFVGLGLLCYDFLGRRKTAY